MFFSSVYYVEVDGHIFYIVVIYYGLKKFHLPH